jgi:hypothetical protein
VCNPTPAMAGATAADGGRNGEAGGEGERSGDATIHQPQPKPRWQTVGGGPKREELEEAQTH